MVHGALALAAVVTGILAAYACKVPPYEPDNSSLNVKGIVAIFLCAFDIIYSAPHDYYELIIVSIVTLIGFVLFFYIIYGVMSLLKISGDDKISRRTKAFWVNAAISIALTLLVQ